jgi:hypothetical protein
VFKIIIGARLVRFAIQRRPTVEERRTGDVVNDFGRDPIGEGKEEQVKKNSVHPLSACDILLDLQSRAQDMATE